MKKVLILCGGASSEHDISIISKDYIVSQLKLIQNTQTSIIILPKDGKMPSELNTISEYDYVIPCFHGFPGETGDIQSHLELYHMPYLGSDSEGHRNAFNKVTTKLYCQLASIPTLDFITIDQVNEQNIQHVKDFFNKHQGVFIKSARQGSSVGCAPAKEIQDIESALKIALEHDSLALVEPLKKARELELSVFEYQGELHVTVPGEVTPPESDFYSFEEKYSQSSSSLTSVKADIPEEKVKEIRQYAKTIFQSLELKDHCRIDFFYDQEQNIYLNEVNTFPGLTPISMFPQMMENYGVKFCDYLEEKINL